VQSALSGWLRAPRGTNEYPGEVHEREDHRLRSTMLRAERRLFDLRQGSCQDKLRGGSAVKIGEMTELVAQGWTNKAIAQKFGTSEQNVKNYIRRVAVKIGYEEHPNRNLRVLIARWHWEKTELVAK
jgi:ATP/maltotriose-dependent transcriptional regulator MalT